MSLTLNDICVVDWGNTSLTKKSYIADGEFLAVSATGADGRINHYEHEADVCVLSAIGAQCGKMFFPQERFTAIKNTITLTPKSDRVYSKYLYYLLTYIELPKRGAAQPFISKGDIQKFVIPYLPPLSEQQRIVEKIDAAFAEIDRASAIRMTMKRDAARIFDNAIAELFDKKSSTWISDKLINVTEKIGSGATPKGGKNAYKEEGISLIRSMNVYDMRFEYKYLAKIDDAQADKLSNVVVQKDDVLLNITGASVARCSVVAADVLPARVNQHVAIIRPKPNSVIPKLLAYELVSKPYKDELLAVGDSGGATRQAITKKQIEEFEVSYPCCVDEQMKIVDRLDELYLLTQELEKIYTEQIEQTLALKSAILAQELQPREAA